MADRKIYKSRSAAVRAARNACKVALGNSFCAYEGPDYGIFPTVNPAGFWEPDVFYFELRGPALTGDE